MNTHNSREIVSISLMITTTVGNFRVVVIREYAILKTSHKTVEFLDLGLHMCSKFSPPLGITPSLC
ncbi:hypothetical protein GIB67_038061 [Kingdonia uniflora]|uniref:Uncharacterized protein n=1 Tax=Kingdonia uniflora TaxID=39325 RepID=A0A7J7N9C8_9MAGN|nr:hypothetical protein GIB67_038061 [Kingdonia uniflora]